MHNTQHLRLHFCEDMMRNKVAEGMTLLFDATLLSVPEVLQLLTVTIQLYGSGLGTKTILDKRCLISADNTGLLNGIFNLPIHNTYN